MTQSLSPSLTEQVEPYAHTHTHTHTYLLTCVHILLSLSLLSDVIILLTNTALSVTEGVPVIFEVEVYGAVMLDAGRTIEATVTPTATGSATGTYVQFVCCMYVYTYM